MSETETARPFRAFADRVNQVPATAPFAWLAAGAAGFRASLGPSLCYGAIFVVAGFVLTGALFVANIMYLFVPLATGFMLVGPAATIGFYAIARDLEAGRRPGFGSAIMAFRANPGPMFSLGLALVAVFTIWLRLSELVVAVTFPAIALDIALLLQTVLHTPEGHYFLLGTLGMGAVLAALVFAGAAFALPLLLDRRIGMIEAIATSWTAVEANIPAMIVWAACLVVMTAVGMALGFVGLAVSLPIAGHATWHAYRATIRTDRSQNTEV